MTLGDMKIGSQLRIGLGSILLFVLLLGGTALYQSDRLWQQQEGLYNHPLVVRRALSDLRYDFLKIHMGMQDLLLAERARERQAIMDEIRTLELHASRQLAVLYDRYLGPRGDIDAIQDSAARWKTVRDETLALLRAGKGAEAARRLRPSGVDGAYEARLMERLQAVSTFALNRGDRFFADATRRKNSLQLMVLVMLAATVSLAALVSYLLLKGIRGPLEELTAAAQQFRNGGMDARSRYRSRNEFGMLSDTFNSLADAVQEELLNRTTASRLVDVMLRQEELRPFCRELLQALAVETGSQVAALFLLNEQKTELEHLESIGLARPGAASFSVAGCEGEFGAALATGRIQHVRDIPAGARLTFSTVCGQFVPAEIMTIPILAGQEVVAVISLTSLHGYSPAQSRLVQELWHVITARLNGVLSLGKIRDFSARLELQNRELDAQKREIGVQRDELTEQNMELELQKNQLDEANRLKSSFLSNMSHELRTPLNSVIALSGVLSRRLKGRIPPEEYGYLEVIERNGRNLLELINDILDLSRIESGREQVSLSPFSVGELAGEIVAMLEHQAREKGIELINGVGGDLPLLLSDEAKCRHILQNLVSNAVKFTDTGSVEIRALAADDSLRIQVRDTGIGIPPDKIDCIFDEFRQADESTTKNYGGTGLGLAIARKYAVMLNGGIRVASTPGKGSTFTLLLPFSRERAPAAAGLPRGAAPPSMAADDSPSRAAGRGRQILVVEDNGPAVIQLCDILSGQGYGVQVARNGKEALERIESSLPDAMILDLMMPEVDGFQVLAAIRGMGKTERIPVLILTAKHVTRQELSFLKGNHIHQLIQKGDVNREELLRSIERMLHSDGGGATPPDRTPAPAPGSGKALVLVMEDNPDSLMTLRAMLEESYRVMDAADGRSGLELARLHKPDIILMDLAMPVMDGYRTLAELRGREDSRRIPVIAVTADAMPHSRERILGHGFDGYLSKPVDWRLLDETIRERLNGSETTDNPGC